MQLFAHLEYILLIVGPLNCDADHAVFESLGPEKYL